MFIFCKHKYKVFETYHRRDLLKMIGKTEWIEHHTQCQKCGKIKIVKV